MNLVAADVSRRICLFSRQMISADSRRRLRLRGLMREIFRGNLSMNRTPSSIELRPNGFFPILIVILLLISRT